MRSLLPLGFASFLLLGVALVLLGATQDAISADLGLSLSRFGMLGSALAVGMGIGTVGAGPLVDRFPRRPIFLAATLLPAAALGLVEPTLSFTRIALHIAVMGIGVGAYDTLLNTVTVERYPARSIRYLSLLHAAVTVGAIAAPLAIDPLLERVGWVAVFHSAGASFLLLSLAVPFVAMPRPVQQHSHEVAGRRLLRRPFVALCVACFAYVGVEACLALFAVPYASEGLGLQPARGRAFISAFWLGILLARIAVALYSDRAGLRPLALSGLAGGAVLAVGVGTGWTSVEWFALATGGAIGSIFPMLIALAGSWYPGRRGAATGLVAGAGSLGGILLPWLTGSLGDSVGVRLAFGSMAFWSASIAAAAWYARRRPGSD